MGKQQEKILKIDKTINNITDEIIHMIQNGLHLNEK